ncbi:MAG: hypothetical protein Fur0024_1840 [Patescibacteria group bacterium]
MEELRNSLMNLVLNGQFEKFLLLTIFSAMFSFLIFLIFEKLDLFKFLNKLPHKIFYILAFLVPFVFLLIWQILRHRNFFTNGLDLGLYSQILNRLSNFEAPESSIRGFKTVWGDHFRPLLYFVAPFSRIFGADYALLIFQSFLIAFGSYRVFKIFSRFGFFAGSILSFGYFSFFGHQTALAFDFHPAIILSPVLIEIFNEMFFKEKPNFYILVILAIVAMISQEYVAIIMVWVFFAIFILKILEEKISFESIKNGFKNFYPLLIFSAFSGIYYIFVHELIIKPNAPNQTYMYFTYETMGENYGDVIKNMIFSPYRTFAILFDTPVKIEAFWELAFVSVFLMIINFKTFFLISVPILMKFLNTDPAINFNFYHYSVYHFSFFIVGFFEIYKLINSQTFFSKTKLLNFANIFFLVIFIISNFFIKKWSYSEFLYEIRPNNQKQEFLKEIKKISKTSYVTGSNKFMAHFGDFEKAEVLCYRDRKTLFSKSFFNNPEREFFELSGKVWIPKNFKTLPYFNEFDYIILSKNVNESYPCSIEELEFVKQNPSYEKIFENEIGIILRKI